MKILYAVVECNSNGHPNAKERYVYNLAIEAKSRGHKVGVVCPTSSVLYSLLTKTSNTGVVVYPIDVKGNWKNIKKFLILYGILRRAKPNIMHFNCPRFGALGGIVSKIARVPKTIYTYHEWHGNPIKSKDLISSFLPWKWPMMKRWIAEIISQIAISSNTHVIALSKKEADKVSNWFGGKNKVTTIYNGIKYFKPVQKEKALIALLGEEPALDLIKSNKKIIGSIAALQQNKGYVYALQGIAQYKKYIGSRFNYHYIVVGSGSDINNLNSIAQNLDINDDVTFVGHIKEAREYIQAFDFLLSNVISDLNSYSSNNSYPQVILEAGIQEVPVIATDTGAINEIIENLETGFLIPPERPAEIKHILNYIDEHSGLERTLAKNFREKIDNELLFSIQADKTFALY